MRPSIPRSIAAVLALIVAGMVMPWLHAETNKVAEATSTNKPPASTQEIDAAAREAERAARREQARLKREGELNAVWTSLSTDEKAQMVRLFQGVRELPKEEAKIIQDGITKFMRLAPEVREVMRGNYKIWLNMSQEQRDTAREQYRQLKRQFEIDWKKTHPGEEMPPFPFRIDKHGNVIPPKSS